MKKRTLSILALLLLLLLVLIVISSISLFAKACDRLVLESVAKIFEHPVIVKDGLEFVERTSKTEHYYSVCGNTESIRHEKYIYVPDEIDGVPVMAVSDLKYYPSAFFSSDALVKFYFPWSVKYTCDSYTDNSISFSVPPTALIISANVNTIAYEYYQQVTVVPYITYCNDKIAEDRKDHLRPANIAYMFNYEDNPNEGYFFIDLVEESGTLMKPPYDPRREGYQFAGWYKDAECTEEWDFETEKIKINFDKEGNRIYEEIKLYAKWVEG